MTKELRLPALADSRRSIEMEKENCLGCGLLPSDPLACLFNRVSKENFRASQEIEITLPQWKEGARLGCVLCSLVQEITRDIALRQGWGSAANVKLLVGPYRNDAPYYIRLAALELDMENISKCLWEVELFVVKGMKSQSLCHSYMVMVLKQTPNILSSPVSIDIDSPLPKLPLRRRLQPDFKSEQCLSLVKTWLHQCKLEHQHAACRTLEQPLLPTRVLDISAPKPKLVLTATNEHGLFAALSHCWGDPNFSSPPKLLRSNLDTFASTGVPVSSLSLSFINAIEVSRYLGYQYLWIDSLCIIQDDNKDWEQESGLMAIVYSNADLVIGASSATQGSQGFLGLRKGYFDGLVSLTRTGKPTATPWQVCYRTSFPHNSFKVNREAFRPTDEGPLDSRAWAYQERLLARRFISFGNHEVCWECTTLLECECYTVCDCHETPECMIPTRTVLLPPRKYNLQRKLEQEISIDALLGAWRKNIVEQYTKRQLTKSTDRLVALSAIAYEFSKKIRHQYLSGIWLSDLDQRGLVWGCIQPSNGTISGAPSWSWASVDGPIIYSTVKSKDRTYCPIIIGLDPLASSTNNFSHPHSSFLQFQGKIMSGASIVRNVVQGPHKKTISFELRIPRGDVLKLYMDADIEKTDALDVDGKVSTLTRRLPESQDRLAPVEVLEGNEVYGGLFCFNIAAPIALLLTKTSMQRDSFQRLGLCVLTGCDVGSWETANIKII